MAISKAASSNKPSKQKEMAAKSIQKSQSLIKTEKAQKSASVKKESAPAKNTGKTNANARKKLSEKIEQKPKEKKVLVPKKETETVKKPTSKAAEKTKQTQVKKGLVSTSPEKPEVPPKKNKSREINFEPTLFDDAVVVAKKVEHVVPEIFAAEPSFDSFPIPIEMLERIEQVGFKSPTPIQQMSLPHTLLGKDVAGFAQTGTGKTAVYSITLGSRFLSGKVLRGESGKPAAIILVPTRELAVQVESDVSAMLAPLKISSTSIFGGTDIERQAQIIAGSVDVVVATTGRLLDLHKQKKISFENVSIVVCDEVDRMFDMGFVSDVEFILKNIPEFGVQKLFFSATGSEKVRELAFEFLESPEYIETNPEKIAPDKIKQSAFAVPAIQKFSLLMGLLKEHNPTSAIVFCNTKVVAEWIGYKLCCNGYAAEVLTGDLPQNKRLSLIKKVKDGEVKILIATDVLSRGLHVSTLSHVYNFDLPDDAESFVHRIGRTARAGAEGFAVTFICEDYGYNMGKVENLLGFSLPLTKPSPEILNLEDKSDFPFDATGRVKSFKLGGEPEVIEKSEFEILGSREEFRKPRFEKQRFEKPQENKPQFEKPQFEKPQFDKPQFDKPQFEKPQFDKPQFEKPQFDKPQFEKPQFEKPKFDKQRRDFTEAPFQASAKTEFVHSERKARPEGRIEGRIEGAQNAKPFSKDIHKDIHRDQYVPRRDERAKEVVDQALAAAKAAAEKRRSLSNPPPPSPAAAAILSVGERVGEIVGTVQGTLQNLLESNKPIFSSLVERFKAGMVSAREKSQKKN